MANDVRLIDANAVKEKIGLAIEQLVGSGMTIVRENENGHMVVQHAMFDVSCADGKETTVLTVPPDKPCGGDSNDEK